MTIFYTGGALLEMDQVTLQQSTTTRNNDFHYNFTSLAEIFAGHGRDPQLLNPPLPFRLGWVVTLAAVGVAMFLWRQPRTTDRRLPRMCEQSGHVWLMLAGNGRLPAPLPAPFLPVWENVPLVDFLQFPGGWSGVRYCRWPSPRRRPLYIKKRKRRKERREEREGEKGGKGYAVCSA
ncbi:MAG: hypothetical protein R3E31_11620 [Chloroflexota bacterium]